ncbi:M23 family metallopeptidase [Aquimarina sp. AU474]|uniref:M23 family metallopeptidase n=1 Tax=Aquimarina sp. AU474 TaxID=2108529 RepID=UPI001F371265|nr:M23 family metallopeptidase [Aquimarina sp. AU474]
MISQQNNVSVDYKTLIVKSKILYLPILPENKKSILDNIDPLNIAEKEQVIDNFAVKWDTVRFNPFHGENIEFPLELAFDSKEFASPVDRKMVVTSRYGWRRGRPHQGIDIDLVVGDSVRTILDGKVRYVRYHGGHGKTVVVRHKNGLETVYAHLSEYLVKENQEVKKGEAIGKGGITGNSRGSHLHLEVRYHGKSINPEYLFEFSNDNTKVRSNKLFVTRKWITPRYHRSTRKSQIVICTTLDDIAKIKENQKKIYTVRKGDTLYGIANKYGLGVSEICKINAIRHNSVLKIGQQIIVN